MNWDDLKVVLAVYRGGSLARAADLANVDASTAGRRLSAIERDLGTVLFARSKAGMTATDAGNVVIDHAMMMEKRAQRMIDALPGAEAGPSGQVRLLSNPWVLTQLADLGMTHLRRHYPDIEITMIADTRRRSIALGECEVSLWFEQTPDDGEFAIPLGDVVYAVYGPSGANPNDLEWMSIWSVKDPIDPMRWLATHVCPDQLLALRSNDPPSLIAAIRQGHGKALLPACMTSRTSGLARMHRELPVLERRLHLHTHPDLVQSPRIQAVMNWVRSIFEDVFGDPDAKLVKAPSHVLEVAG